MAPSPPSQMSPLFLAACPWPSLPHSPSQLDICNTNRRKVSTNLTISQLLPPTSILLLPLSLSHYKYLLRPWEEAGKPFQVRTENEGDTINVIESLLRFLWDLINTRLRSGWCGVTWAVRMTAISHHCLFWGLCQLVMVMLGISLYLCEQLVKIILLTFSPHLSGAQRDWSTSSKQPLHTARSSSTWRL